MQNKLNSFIDATLKLVPFKQFLFTLIRPLNIRKRIWNRLVFQGLFTINLNDCRFSMCHHGDSYTNGIYWTNLVNGWAEEQALRLWMDLCKSSNTVLDIGANVGIYSLVAMATNSSAKVFAFEPVTETYQKLCQNCGVNNFDICTTHVAVSDLNGVSAIHLVPGNFLTPSLEPGGVRTAKETIRTIRLSEFIEEKNIVNVDLMKIDVEGFEPQVLRGMGGYLSSMKPTIIIEVLSQETAEVIQELVSGLGYSYFNIDENRGAVRQKDLSPKGKGRHSRNFLLCQDFIADRLSLA